MSDAFISYSNKDAAFVRRLNNAFVQAERVVWVDWQDIPPGEDWWIEIQKGVLEADAFLCTVSEHWLMSETCHRELSHARANNKRVVWLIRQKIEAETEQRVKDSWVGLAWEQQAKENWNYLRHLNWISFEDDDTFDIQFTKLQKTIESDQPHIKAHTRYQNLALEWEASGQNPSYLLSGDNLTFATKWLKTSENKNPKPTLQQEMFVEKSHEEEQKRERRIRRYRQATIVGVIAIVTALIGSVVGIQSTVDANNAKTQVAIANMTLSPVPMTLAAVGSQVANAQIEEHIGQQLANAILMVATSNNDDALLISYQLATQYPDISSAHIAQGIISKLLGNTSEAENEFGIALVLDPTLRLISYNSDTESKNPNQIKNSILFYTEVIKDNPNDVLAYYHRGSAYVDLKEYDKALTDLSKAIELNPKDMRAYYSRGNSYREINEYQKAIKDYSQAIELNPQYFDAYNNRGNVYRSLKQYETAITDYTQAINIAPKSKIFYLNRGNVYFDLGEYEKAVADYTKAIELDSEFAAAYFERGAVYSKLKKYDLALEDLNKAIDIEPDHATYYDWRASVYEYRPNPDFDRAMADANKAINMEPNTAALYRRRAYINYDQEKYDLAIPDFTKAIKLDPLNKEGYYWRAISYEYLSVPDLDRALADANKAIELDPNNSVYYRQRAFINYDRKKFDLAIEDFTKAIKLNPNDAPSYRWRASSYESLTHPDLDRALADANKAIELAPDNSSNYKQRAYIYIDQQQYASAQKDLSKSIEMNPTDSNAYNWRAYTYLYQAKPNVDLALADLNKAIEINPNYNDPYKQLGYLYDRQKKYDLALENFKRYIALAGKSAIQSVKDRVAELEAK